MAGRLLSLVGLGLGLVWSGLLDRHVFIHRIYIYGELRGMYIYAGKRPTDACRKLLKNLG